MDVSLPPVLRDVVVAAVGVALVGAILFAATGVWPPMVAVESESMSPHLQTGDLVVVSSTDRYAPAAADEFGVVTARQSRGYTRFDARGDVLVFDPPSWQGSPIIHRAHLRVTEGENWYSRANHSALPPNVDSCADLTHCPAPNAGYVTRGDHNVWYDQAIGRSPPVRPSWIRAKGQVNVPYMGWIRLWFQRMV